MFKIIKKYLKLVGQGATLRDKTIIFSYLFFNAPLNILGNNKNHNLIGKVTVKSNDGIFFCGDNIFAVWVGSSFHEPKMRKYFNLDRGVFIDVGANIGKYSVIVGRKLKDNGKVISMEPLPGNFRIFKKNIKLNNLQNVIPLQIALGSEEKQSKFYIDKEGIGGGGHSLVKETPNKIRVRVKKLDNIVNDLKIKKIDLIKIDAEGAEADVLKGAKEILKKSHPKIIFEAWDEEYLKKVEEVLKPFGYKIKKIAEENYLAY